MNRRSFLGQLLGTMVISQTDWIGSVVDKILGPSLIITAEDLYNCSQERLGLLRLATCLTNGETIKGSDPLTINKTDEEIIFQFQDIKIKQELEIAGHQIVDLDGQPISSVYLQFPHTARLTDTLKVNYKVTSYPGASFSQDLRKHVKNKELMFRTTYFPDGDLL